MNDDIYQEIILERYKSPLHKGKIEGAQEATEVNYLCGDKIKLYVAIKDEKIEDVKFEGGGCAISQAAMDLLIDEIKGKKVEDVKNMKGSEVEEMLGVSLTPARKKCAYLGLEVLRKIIKNEP